MTGPRMFDAEKNEWKEGTWNQYFENRLLDVTEGRSFIAQSMDFMDEKAFQRRAVVMDADLAILRLVREGINDGLLS